MKIAYNCARSKNGHKAVNCSLNMKGIVSVIFSQNPKRYGTNIFRLTKAVSHDTIDNSTRMDLLPDTRIEALLMDPLANERIKELTAAVKQTVNQHSISSASCSIGCSKNVILLNRHFIWHYLTKYFAITRAAIYNLFNKYTIIGYQLLKFKDRFIFLPSRHFNKQLVHRPTTGNRTTTSDI